MKYVNKKFTNLDDAIANLIKTANDDYCDRNSQASSDVVQKMQDQFTKGWTVKSGSKYISIYKTLGSQQMIWGGIVATDNHKKFKKGDILMANGFRTFAQNAARGNILQGSFGVQWTGANYL
tara:strand:- start:2071 stop:2436 length:366 start_codon:yes stop_codon:yes gene_type:complete